jgi:hypothetical protein
MARIHARERRHVMTGVLIRVLSHRVWHHHPRVRRRCLKVVRPRERSRLVVGCLGCLVVGCLSCLGCVYARLNGRMLNVQRSAGRLRHRAGGIQFWANSRVSASKIKKLTRSSRLGRRHGSTRRSGARFVAHGLLRTTC